MITKQAACLLSACVPDSRPRRDGLCLRPSQADWSAHSMLQHAGYPQYELVEGGSDVIVDSQNVGEYIDAVVNATMHEGIAAQMQAFR